MDQDVKDARQRIALSAFRLFGERGYSCTSIQDIADAAKVRKAMVYYYFQSKEGLYQTLVSESSAGMRDMLTQVMLGSEEKTTSRAQNSCIAKLEAIAELMISLSRDNRDSVRFFLSHMFAADADRPACDFEEAEHVPPKVFLSLATCGIKQGELRGDPLDLTRLLLGGIHVSILRYLRHPDQEPLSPGLGRRLVRALLRGFGPQPAATPEKAPEKVSDKASDKASDKSADKSPDTSGDKPSDKSNGRTRGRRGASTKSSSTSSSSPSSRNHRA